MDQISHSWKRAGKRGGRRRMSVHLRTKKELPIPKRAVDLLGEGWLPGRAAGSLVSLEREGGRAGGNKRRRVASLKKKEKPN